MQTCNKILGLAAGAALLAGAAIAVVPGSNAWASSTSSVTFCSDGGYDTEVTIGPGGPNLNVSFIVPAGDCDTEQLVLPQTVTLTNYDNGDDLGTLSIAVSEEIKMVSGDDYEVIS
jgi:hypothetical protein